MSSHCLNERLITFVPKASILTVVYCGFCRRWRTAVSGVLILWSPLQMNPHHLEFGSRRESHSTASFIFLCACLSILFNVYCLSGGRTIRYPPPFAPKTNTRCEVRRLHTRPRGPSPLAPSTPTVQLSSTQTWVETSPSFFPPAF